MKQLFSGDGKKANYEAVAMRWLPNSDIRLMLFSLGAVLVEGLSDKMVLQAVGEYLSKKGKTSVLDIEWPIINADGKDSILTFAKFAKSLGIRFVAVFDRDALMSCARDYKQDGSRISSSTVLKALRELDNISQSESIRISELTKIKVPDEKDKTRYWFPDESYSELSEIARMHNCYVFSTDLEGTLRTNTSRSAKPLHDVKVVLERIENGTLETKEFSKLFSYIENIAMANL